MKDITPFLSASTIKPELSLIYVKIKGNKKVAVATDSYKLVEYILPDFLQEHMSEGYYTKETFKKLCKAMNKKNIPIIEVMDLLNFEKSIQDRYNGFEYPDYERIVPKEDDLKAFDGSLAFSKENFTAFLDLIDGDIDFRKYKMTTHGMLFYKTDNMHIFIMSLRK